LFAFGITAFQNRNEPRLGKGDLAGNGHIGNVQFQWPVGVALDDKYFYRRG